MLDKSFAGSKVLVTGHTGFKGFWLSLVLHSFGAKVYGYSLDVPTHPSHYDSKTSDIFEEEVFADIAIKDKFKQFILNVKPDYVFHLAAQPIVKKSIEDPFLTFSSNVMGTVSVLDALRFCTHNITCVFVTSDKCYQNNEWVYGYREVDRLGGHDPYSASKACAELAFYSCFNSILSAKPNILCASARAGNVIGGGDWTEARIVPDAFRAWTQQKTLLLRSPGSTRPWQHVLEPIFGYLLLADKLSQCKALNGESFNFGPPSISNKTVLQLVQKLSLYWCESKYECLPSDLVECNLLSLCCDKASLKLGWQSILDFDTTVSLTAEWYSSYQSNKSHIIDFSLKQINFYADLFIKKFS